MFKKILIPVDGSEASHKAVEFARDFAEKYSSEVIILHVLENVFKPRLMGEYVLVTDLQKLPEPSEFELLKPALEIFNENKTKVKPLIEFGTPAEKIVSIAEEEHADLIVIGSRGLGGVIGFFLGSVSKEVVNDAPCPVLVVK